MNNIYKVIWSKAKNCYVVASEIAKSHTKSASGQSVRRSALASLLALSLLCGGLGVASAADEVSVEPSTSSSAVEVYTKEKVNTLLDGKANKDEVYNKNEVYSAEEVAAALSAKADQTALNQATDKINTQQAWIGKLKDKTTEISYAAGEGTKISGVTITNGNIVGNGNSAITGLTNVQTDNINGKSLAGTTVATEKEVADAVKAETDARTAADDALSGRITDNANEIARVNQELVNTNTHFNTELGKTNAALQAEGQIRANADAALADDIKATNKRTAGIGRTDTGVEADNQTVIEGKVHFDQNGNVSGVKDLQTDTIHANGEITSKGLNAGDGDIKTSGTVSAGNVSTGTLETTGDATIGRDLTVKGTLNTKDVAAETIHISKSEDTVDYKSEGSIIGEGGNLSVSNKKTDKITNITEESQLHVNEKGTVNWATSTENATGNVTEGRSEVTADHIKNSVMKTEGGKTFGYDENITADGKVGTATDKDGNRNELTQTATGTENTVTSKDGNKSTTKQEAGSISSTVYDKDGNVKASSEMKEDGSISNNATGDMTNTVGGKLTTTVTGQATENFKGGLKTDITGEEIHTVTGNQTNKVTGKQTNTVEGGQENIISGGQENNILTGDQKTTVSNGSIINKAENGNISNTATNVTNEGTESVTNKVRDNEVKVYTNGVDITAEAGKTIKESVGADTSRTMTDGNIIDKAGNMTVTTDKTTGTTFGNGTPNDTTVINGGTIGTNKVNANETNTKKLTAGADDGAVGGRLTVDANDGVKGSYKSGDYTSRSYILANTLKSGVDNGKEPTEDDFVGSRTDHYMDGNKAKLDETVKDAAGSNVTNKTSTGTVTTITDGTTTTKTDQGVKDITNTAKNGTITNDAKDIVNIAKDTITNTAGTSITNQVNDSKVTTDANGTTFENNTPAVSDGGATTTKINGNQITTGRVNANELGVSDKDGDNTADFSVEAGEGKGVNASASDGNTTGSLDVKADGITTSITNRTDHNTVSSTLAGGTIFTNSEAAAPVTGASGAGTAVNTTIKGNTITTGKVTMDYAEVMKDLGVRGNANITGKTTTGSLEVTGTSTLKGEVTMERNATVKKDLKVEGTTTTKTLKVTENAEIDGNATIKGDVTAKSYKVGDKTYIDANGINANDQKITNVADGSISEGSKDAVNGGQLYGVKRDLEHQVDKVGANAAAMANLRPMEFDPSSKWNIAAAIGNYGSETAAALGAFYRPNDDVMVNLSTAFGTGENMVGGGVSVRLGKGGNKLSREENNALKDQVNDLTARMDALLSVLNPNMSKDFPDVPENHWAYEAVSRLAGNDIVQGYPDGEFHGERTMTRYEMAEIIYNALSRGAEAEKELVEEFKPELQAMAASEKATAEKAEG